MGNDTIFFADIELYQIIGDLFSEAEKEILILSPWIELTGHLEELLKMYCQRGEVNITVLTRKPTDSKHGEAIDKLQKLGAKVFFDPKLHAKLILIDREAVLVTSSNIVLRSMTENHEVGILTWESEVLERVLGYLTHLQSTLHNPILSRSDERFPPDKKPLRKIVTKILRRKKDESKKPEFENCPKCGKKLVKRKGKTGLFWGCTGYPDCYYTRNIEWKKK